MALRRLPRAINKPIGASGFIAARDVLFKAALQL
jgi:hypothetical protein